MTTQKKTLKEWTKRVRLKDGTSILLRPELSTNLEMLWEVFSTLSDESLRFLPKPFPRERVESWIENLNYYRALPILAIVEEGSEERIVGSATLAFSQAEAFKHKAEFGITVHDDYQDRGLGTALKEHIIEIARSKGLKKISLTVVTEKSQAIRVYEKCGFRIEGRLEKDHYNYITGE